MVPPADLDGLSHAELKSLVIKQFEVIAELQRTVAALRDEIARLKGGPRRPNIKPSGMERATEPKPDKPAGEGQGKRGSTKTKLTIHEEKTVKVDAPAGSRFKGYTSYIVQELVVRAHVINFRCERWLAPDGNVRHCRTAFGVTSGRNCAGLSWPNTTKDRSRFHAWWGYCKRSASSFPSDRSCVC